MIRQRVNLRQAPWAAVTRALVILFALLLIYGGVLDALLALKVIGPGRVEQLTAYRTVFHWVSGLHRYDFTTVWSLVSGIGGLLVFLFFVFLSGQALPRPYLARQDLDLEGERGTTAVRPRAIERIAEVAARGNSHIVGVTGRLGDDELSVDVGIDDVDPTVEVLGDVRRRVVEGLSEHHIPAMPVNVTLTGYEPTTKDRP